MKYLGIVLISILSMSVLLDVSPAAAKLSLAQLEHDHKSYRERLISSAEKKGLPDVAAALAQSKAAAEAGRGGEALRLLELAAGRNPDHYLLWIRLGQMWGDLAPLSADAQSAAYGAYLLAGRPEEEAEALFLLANLSAQSVKKLKESQTAAEDKIAEIEATINKSSDKVPDSGTSRTFTGNEDDLSESALIKLRCAQVTPKEKRKAESVRLTELYRLLDASLSQLCDANERIAEAAKTAAIAYQEIFTILKAQGDPKRYTGSRFPEIAKAFALKAKGASFKLSDSASAACFYFTMQLKPDVSLYKAKFVEVYREKDENNEEEETRFSKEPIQTDITIKRDELCVHGLSHGKTYQFLFKSGLPSGNGLELAEAVFIKARVPDRTATITFQSSAFIVPSHGERVIPMSTVNVQNVRLELFRISDRSLNQEIALGKFGAELDGKKLRELTDNFAELMWTGEKGIESRPNQSVITRLPMYEVLQARRAWVRSRNAPAASSAANANGHFSNGKFAGGSAAFQSSSTKPWEPGVFALIATLPSDQTPLQTGSGEGSFPVQWFIYTDIGLTYYKTTSKLYVIAHSLSSGKEISNVRVELVSANNRVLGSQNTDSNGVAAFDTRLANGEQGNRLAAILAYGDDDFSFLDFTHDNFDLSNYNVSGRSPPKGLDAYVYTDRGVYKPAANEPVNITVLLRDAKGVIPQLSAPLNLRIISSKTGTAIASAKIPAA